MTLNLCNPHHYKEDIVVGGVCEAMLLQEPLTGNGEGFNLDILSFWLLLNFPRMSN